MPFVAIVGGLWQLEPQPREEARNLARSLGEELAKAGMGLVVYFSHEDSLEPHVVAGYVPAVPDETAGKPIRVRYAQSQRGLVTFPEQGTRGDLFEPAVTGPDWESPFYRSLVDENGVDAVLLMAGYRSTLIAGQIAVARRLPILAIDRFGGSAETIWSELNAAGTHPSASIATPAQLVAYLKRQCDERARLKREAREREQLYLRVTTEARKGMWAGGAFVVLLLTVIFGVAFTPDAGLYPMVMFAALIAAGATGALVRAVIWGGERTAPVTSLVLGSVAGFVVGLAYLIPQFVGAPDVLQPASDVVSSTNKIQFLSALLVAISAGIGFDTVFNRLKKQAEDVPVGPKL
jgi:hypothetical protein